MSNVPGANLLDAICCSRTLTNWRMRPHRSAAVSPALRDTTRQYAAISTFCTSLHEILGSLICSRLIASLISLVRSMRFSVANRPPPVASPIRSGTRPGPISGHSRFPGGVAWQGGEEGEGERRTQKGDAFRRALEKTRRERTRLCKFRQAKTTEHAVGPADCVARHFDYSVCQKFPAHLWSSGLFVDAPYTGRPPCLLLGYCPSRCLSISWIFFFTASRLKDAGSCTGG